MFSPLPNQLKIHSSSLQNRLASWSLHNIIFFYPVRRHLTTVFKICVWFWHLLSAQSCLLHSLQKQRMDWRGVNCEWRAKTSWCARELVARLPSPLSPTTLPLHFRPQVVHCPLITGHRSSLPYPPTGHTNLAYFTSGSGGGHDKKWNCACSIHIHTTAL